MFKNFFKRKWITDEVVNYLCTLPRYFRISYTINANGHIVKFTIRDEDCKLMDFNQYDRRVTGIVVEYQDFSLGGMTYYVDDVVTQKDIPYLREKFDEFVKKFPISKSSVKAKELYDMQCQLREKIESVTGAVGAYDGKDLIYNLSAIDGSTRQRILDTVARFGKGCVETMLMITISGSTDEEMGSTMDELALIEANDESNSKETDTNESFGGGLLI